MMRRAEGTLYQQPLSGHQARRAVNPRGFKRLVEGHVGQNRRHAARQQRLARAGRADHDYIVAAGRSNLQRALGAPLALDKGKIHRRLTSAHQRLIGHLFKRRNPVSPGQMIEGFDVLDDLASVRTNWQDRPLEPVVIKTIYEE